MTAVELAEVREASDAQVAHSAGLLAVRRAALALLSALATAVIAHRLGVAEFGAYSAGLAAFYLLQSACDFGFGTVLARELAVRPSERHALFGSTIAIAMAWSILVSVGLGVMAIAAGLGTPRGLTMVALMLPLAVSGLSVARQIFIVDYQVGQLARVDVLVSVAQGVGLVGLAFAGSSPWILAAWLGITTTAGTVWIAVLARRRVAGHGPVSREHAREVIRLSAPLGLVSFLASAYFLLDITIVGYLVSSEELAPYAAAVKVLSIVVALPALILGAALPAMSVQSQDRKGMSELAGLLWHWMAATLVPLSVGIFVFAPYLVRLLFGPSYASAVPLLRILICAGVVTFLSAIVGNILVARRRASAMLLQNSGAVVFNVTGNILLVPLVGVVASAWLTLGTEVFVCAASAFLLRGSLNPRPMFKKTWRPVVAMAGIVAAAAIPQPLVAVVVAIALFVGLMTALRAWPAEFPLLGRFAT